MKSGKYVSEKHEGKVSEGAFGSMIKIGEWIGR